MTEKVAVTCFTLTLVTILTRIAPLFATNWLRERPWMDRVAAQLPCMILILLIFHDAQTRISTSTSSISATAAGIIATLVVQRWKRQTVLSIAAGVIAYALTNLFIPNS